MFHVCTLVENLVVLNGDCVENNCVTVCVDGNVEESLLVLCGDVDENRGLDEMKEVVNLLGRSVVLDGEIDENN